jgi:hypothetical protein
MVHGREEMHPDVLELTLVYMESAFVFIRLANSRGYFPVDPPDAGGYKVSPFRQWPGTSVRQARAEPARTRQNHTGAGWK